MSEFNNKYSLGDTIYYINGERSRKYEILSVKINQWGIFYDIGISKEVNQDFLFSNIEEGNELIRKAIASADAF